MAAAMKWPNRMNPTDAMLWFMDKTPEFRSTAATLVVLKRPPVVAGVRQEFDRLSEKMVRMRQRVVEVPFGLATPEWIEDENFDLDYHVRRVCVPAPGRLEDLLEEMGPLYATPFDLNRPLWEAYTAEGLADGSGALFVKMHHCLIDGVGGSRMFEPLIAGKRWKPLPVRRRKSASRSAAPVDMVWRALRHDMGEVAVFGRVLANGLAGAVRNPWTPVEAFAGGIRAATGFSRELIPRSGDHLARPARSLSRALATFDMRLSEVDRVRGHLGATINDVVLVIVSGAMHRWHRLNEPDAEDLRVLVPFNLRGHGDTTPGNRIGVFSLRLPVGEPDPVRRLRIIQERMGQAKTDHRASLYPYFARLMLAMPIGLAEHFGRLQTSRTNFVCSNIPGPRRTCFLAGEKIERIYPYIPLVGDHPIAISIYSYCDILCVGIDVDPLVVGKPGGFRKAMRESYEEVLRTGSRVRGTRARTGKLLGSRAKRGGGRHPAPRLDVSSAS